MRLPCPLAALGGEADARYRREQLEAWRECALPGYYQQRWFRWV